MDGAEVRPDDVVLRSGSGPMYLENGFLPTQ